MTRHKMASLIALAATILIVGFAGPRRLTRVIDENLPGEPIKDTWGRVHWHEDWASAPPVDARRVDASWLDISRGRELRIAHALGAPGGPAANTLPAMQKAVAQGFRFFEVDLWLDHDGILRCFHGDNEDSQPAPFQPDDCTFEQVLAALPQDAWLILDIKSGFERTGGDIVRQLHQDGRQGRRLIFQLYHPADVAAFTRWSRIVTLGAPIVTTYAAHRSIRHIRSQLDRLDIHAMTVPLDRLSQAGGSTGLQLLLTHPVHDCDAMVKARAGGARGFYTSSSLGC